MKKMKQNTHFTPRGFVKGTEWGEMADRLAQIVDRYMPKVAGENRTYVMRYPGQVKTMLQKAWGLRKSICDRANKSQRRKAGRRGEASASGEPDSFAQQRAGRWKKVAVWGGKGLLCM